MLNMHREVNGPATHDDIYGLCFDSIYNAFQIKSKKKKKFTMPS